MNIKTSKVEFHVANWMILMGLLIVDNMYANHCKKKKVSGILEKAAKSDSKSDGES